MQTEPQVISASQDTEASMRWDLTTRIAFRFAFVYAILYIFGWLAAYVPYLGSFIVEGEASVWKALVPWVSKHILHLSYNFTIIQVTGRDTTAAYVRVFSCLLIAALATIIWSVLDRKRHSYPKLYEWLKLAVRLWLVSCLTYYGAYKAPYPAQMAPPSLMTLVQQYGDLSPMSVLWNFMGSSPKYQIITGYVELLAGVLLIFPRTTLLGSLLALVAMTQVFILNMCYDVPIKLFSFHILLGVVFLLTLHLRRLARLFVYNRPVEPVKSVPLFRRKRFNHAALGLQLLLGLYITGANIVGAQREMKPYYKAANPPLYGIYTVEEYSVNGEVRPPLATDATRWRRIIFDRDNFVYIQPMTGETQPFLAQVDEQDKAIVLTKRRVKGWKAAWSFVEPEPGHVVIEGQFDNQQYKASLVRVDESKFLLLSRGFHWVQDYPVNR
jgi:hypothetical protein